VEVNEGQEIRLWAYNVDQETAREVALTPNRGWGGQGMLGCDVSFGYFNKIPMRPKDLDRRAQKEQIRGIIGKVTGEEP